MPLLLLLLLLLLLVVTPGAALALTLESMLFDVSSAGNEVDVTTPPPAGTTDAAVASAIGDGITVFTSVQIKRPSDPPEEITVNPIGANASNTLIGGAFNL